MHSHNADKLEAADKLSLSNNEKRLPLARAQIKLALNDLHLLTFDSDFTSIRCCFCLFRTLPHEDAAVSN